MQAASNLAWASTQSGRDLWLFTDESRLADGHKGAGFVLDLIGRFLLSGHNSGCMISIMYHAEVVELVEGLKAAFTHSAAGLAHNLWFCLDNQAVVRLTYGHPSSTSQLALMQAITLLDAWGSRSRLN